MSLLLRALALVAFVIAAFLALAVDAPEGLDVLGAISVGLALWVGSTLAD